jgi:secreted PhoX family phosphatase
MNGEAMGQPPYTALGNNALLCADLASGEIKRFMTGPSGCEITGFVVTPDRSTLFVNIQHPGESHEDGTGVLLGAWPDGQAPGSARPRSATLVVRHRDQLPVGS